MKRSEKIPAPYQDPYQPTDARVQDLLGRMTIEEKIQQMAMIKCEVLLEDEQLSTPSMTGFFGDKGIGALEDPRLDPQTNANIINTIQQYLRQQTRLGIPAIIYAECLHGHMSGGATVFPQAIGLASTWDTDLIREIAAVVAQEARAVGVSQGVGPVLDLARDPRWGRCEETYGEDPYLASRLGVAFVKGLQGQTESLDRKHVIAMLKHFAGYGSPQGGLNMGAVSAGVREMRELHLRSFKAAIVEARAMAVMPAYHEVDGVPCHKSKFLLQQILRDEWGFGGYVFSDYSAILMLKEFHRCAADLADAGRQALEAGLDMEGPRVECFGDKLLKLINDGTVSINLIDQAVSRILRVKFLAGIFENPFAEDAQRVEQLVHNPMHRQLARKAAQDALILLKNEGEVLPLNPSSLKRIAVIGPNANIAELGGYSVVREAVTPLEGIRNALGNDVKVEFAKGCGIHQSSREGFQDAVECARNADVAVLCMGEASMGMEGIGWAIQTSTTSAARPHTCGEGYDRADLDVPGIQNELVQAIVDTGTPVVVVLISGRANSIPWIAEHVPAVLHAWYPGEEGGNGIADVLFGKVNPSGKLPVSIPKTVGQLPVFYNYKPTARGYSDNPGSPNNPGMDYVFMSPEPLFSFGHGLSYTRFEYSDLQVSQAVIRPSDSVEVSIDVANTGRREGAEVVQLYVNDVVSSVSTPVRQLCGFCKIHLEPTRQQTVRFTLEPEHLSLWNEQMQCVVEPGEFEVMIGPLTQTFSVAL